MTTTDIGYCLDMHKDELSQSCLTNIMNKHSQHDDEMMKMKKLRVQITELMTVLSLLYLLLPLLVVVWSLYNYYQFYIDSNAFLSQLNYSQKNSNTFAHIGDFNDLPTSQENGPPPMTASTPLKIDFLNVYFSLDKPRNFTQDLRKIIFDCIPSQQGYLLSPTTHVDECIRSSDKIQILQNVSVLLFIRQFTGQSTT